MELVYGKDSHLWALPTQGLGHLLHYWSKASTRGSSSPGAGELEEGSIHPASKIPCTYCMCQACGLCCHRAAETNTTVPAVAETYSKSSDT